MNDMKFLVTGATGLIGSALVNYLLGQNARVIAPVRNLEKARKKFGDEGKIELVECDLNTTDFSFAKDVDYVVHCAAPTSSAFFVEHPVETFESIVMPTRNLLEFAKRCTVKGFVYLSSLEVYGEIMDDDVPVTEDMLGNLDLLSPRSSYPMGKRAAEHICHLYASEFGVPVCIARLTQTTGEYAKKEDNRILVSFCRKARNGEDIVLHTTGESARPYCHVLDVVSAIETLLQKGAPGEAYNVANEKTYLSARELAEFIRQEVNPGISVRTELKENAPYAPVTRLRLSTEKLRDLGWEPKHDLRAICESYQ